MPDRFGRLMPSERAANARFRERQEEREHRRRTQEEDRRIRQEERNIRLQRQQEQDAWQRMVRDRQQQEWQFRDQERARQQSERARQERIRKAQEQANYFANRRPEGVSGLVSEAANRLRGLAEPALGAASKDAVSRILKAPDVARKERKEQEAQAAKEAKALMEADRKRAQDRISYNKRLEANTKRILNTMGDLVTTDVIDEATGLAIPGQKQQVWVPVPGRENQTYEQALAEAQRAAAGGTVKVPGFAAPSVASEALPESSAPGTSGVVEEAAVGGGFDQEYDQTEAALIQMLQDPGLDPQRRAMAERILENLRRERATTTSGSVGGAAVPF